MAWKSRVPQWYYGPWQDEFFPWQDYIQPWLLENDGVDWQVRVKP